MVRSGIPAWGISILECFKEFFMGSEDAWIFLRVIYWEYNFWTFVGVLCENQTFWMLNVFLEFFLVRISDLSFWSSLWGSKFLHAFSRRVLCGDQSFWLSFGIPFCGDLNFWMMCGGQGSEILNVFFGVFMVVRILECLCKSSIGIRFYELFSKFFVGINFCSFYVLEFLNVVRRCLWESQFLKVFWSSVYL